MKFYALKVLDDFQSLTTPASKTPFNALTSAENEKKETECRLLNEKRDFLLKIREFKPNNVRKKTLRYELKQSINNILYYPL